jgi:galactokinase
MPDTAASDAPGRVNLIGEHTDYHQGLVLPAVIRLRTIASVTLRDDRRVRARSAAVAGGFEDYEIGREQPGRGWLDYIQGITVVLRRNGITAPGFDVQIQSAVPLGAGVSSSAALEVSVLRALRALRVFEADDLSLATLAHKVETDFVGAPVGVMDQIAVSLGRDGEALFIDTRTLRVARIPIPHSIEIVVIDSGVPHAHAEGKYASRRQESFDAAARLGVEWLRDLDGTALARIAALPQPLAGRARHVVTENQRVLDAVDALRSNDVVRLGALFAASHESMRDDYETSTPEVDTLVTIAQRHPDVYGARLTGGGFGGAVVILARQGHGSRVAVAIRDTYRDQTDRHGIVLVPTPEIGAAQIS